MRDDISIGNVKNVSEEKGADRRRFLKYTAGAVVLAAAAATGYYALTTQPAPAPTTTAAITPTTTVPPPSVTIPTTEVHIGLAVTSQAFGNGERIPSKYTCDGEDISPPISWSGAPEETRSYALIVDDVDAPAGTFTHWVIFNIPRWRAAYRKTSLLPKRFPMVQYREEMVSERPVMQAHARHLAYTTTCFTSTR